MRRSPVAAGTSLSASGARAHARSAHLRATGMDEDGVELIGHAKVLVLHDTEQKQTKAQEARAFLSERIWRLLFVFQTGRRSTEQRW